jgi:hypothetical protein
VSTEHDEACAWGVGPDLELLQVTKKGSPDRPVLLRRLAEGYAELERLARLEQETAKLRAERADREDA